MTVFLGISMVLFVLACSIVFVAFGITCSCILADHVKHKTHLALKDHEENIRYLRKMERDADCALKKAIG